MTSHRNMLQFQARSYNIIPASKQGPPMHPSSRPLLLPHMHPSSHPLQRVGSYMHPPSHPVPHVGSYMHPPSHPVPHVGSYMHPSSHPVPHVGSYMHPSSHPVPHVGSYMHPSSHPVPHVGSYMHTSSHPLPHVGIYMRPQPFLMMNQQPCIPPGQGFAYVHQQYPVTGPAGFYHQNGLRCDVQNIPPAIHPAMMKASGTITSPFSQVTGFRKVSVSDAATETDSVSWSDTEPSRVESRVVSMSDAATETNIVSVSDVATETHVVSASSVATETDIVSVSNVATETGIVSLSDAATGTNIVSLSDAATGSDTVSASNVATETDIVSLSDAATGSDTVSASNVATETDIVSLSDAATGSDMAFVVDSATQSEETPMSNTATQSEETPMSNTATQSEETPMSNTATQSEETPMSNTVAQSEEISMSNTATQSEETPMCTSATQSEETPTCNTATESDETAMCTTESVVAPTCTTATESDAAAVSDTGNTTPVPDVAISGAPVSDVAPISDAAAVSASDIASISKAATDAVSPAVRKRQQDTSRGTVPKVYKPRNTQRVKLLVRNLDYSVDDQRLHREFLPFGTVISAKVVMENGRSRGFGFVCFSSPEEATNALTKMNGRMLSKRELFVTVAQSREEYLKHEHEQRTAYRRTTMPPRPRIPKSGQGIELRYFLTRPQQHPVSLATAEPIKDPRPSTSCERNTVRVKNLDHTVDDKQLRKEFLPFGTVISAKVVMKNDCHQGLGYVKFMSHDQAMKAIKEMNGKMLEKKLLDVALCTTPGPETKMPEDKPREEQGSWKAAFYKPATVRRVPGKKQRNGNKN